MANKYLCIHGHFYQPPRENPWLEEIEFQESAKPYHDWNARISTECYGPNRASRILDGEGQIIQIVNNYASMSFNFGPTLLAWMEKHAKRTYEKILEADSDSQKKFSGHGSAMAQVYNHIIMPLAHDRDKRTQVLWGIADFKHRYQRNPEGMWLAETAVDIPTLEILAEQGIIFTILAPHQAKRVRKMIKGGRWHDVSNGSIDPKKSYRCNLPSGKSINLFFYDGPVSREVAFEKILSNGEGFAQRLISLFADQPDPQLVHIAADGETYGHHFQFGDMALAYALQSIEKKPDIKITNYSEFLDHHPPNQEVEIIENTSWSCAHGMERWKSNCGCHILGKPGWNQEWRGPLRDALDWLRDQCMGRFESRAAIFLKDPWHARDLYIQIILHRTEKAWEEFLYFNATRVLTEKEQIETRKLLEIQRNALLMYTSCGWFFDEISGIETVQILKYAARAIQLVQEVFGEDLAGGFLEILKKARSNVTEFSDGAWIYQNMAKAATVDLAKVAAHYAMRSLFDAYPSSADIFCYTVTQEGYRIIPSGKAKLALGHVKVTSRITRESRTFVVSFIHSGDQDVFGGVLPFQNDSDGKNRLEEIEQEFYLGEKTKIVQAFEKHFHANMISLNYLFADEKRRIIRKILHSTLIADTKNSFSDLYRQYAPSMHFLQESGLPIPNELLSIVQFFLQWRFMDALNKDPMDFEELDAIMEESDRMATSIISEDISFLLTRKLSECYKTLRTRPEDISLLRKMTRLAEIGKQIKLPLDLWGTQNAYFEIIKNRPASTDSHWLSEIKKLAKLLHVRSD